MNACIFAGPTLPPGDEARTPSLTWLPPARHGDVYRAVTLLHPRAIGIVDGYFQWAPSVWHKEILWAVQNGVHVFGAASMGALRAAELAAFGMRGVGRIFTAYRDGVLAECGDEPFEDDDEVAVVHGPPESGYLAGSEAMVNIRCTLAEAERAGIVRAATRARLVAIAKGSFFPERSYDALLSRARAEGLPAAEVAALQAWLPAGRVNQKRADAIAMLDAICAFLATDPAPARAEFTFEHTTLWDRAVAELRLDTIHDEAEALALDELRLDGARFQVLRGEVLRALTAQSDGPGQRAERNTDGLSLDEAAKMEALRRAQQQIPPAIVERRMLARLRATGEYAKLLARAEDKRARLAGRKDLPHIDEFSELQLLQLRDWYFSRSPGGDMPEDLQRYLLDAGYAGTTRFHEAIFAEYVYLQMSDGGAVAADRAPVNA